MGRGGGGEGLPNIPAWTVAKLFSSFYHVHVKTSSSSILSPPPAHKICALERHGRWSAGSPQSVHCAIWLIQDEFCTGKVRDTRYFI